ncbi:MAG: serine/threonine protein kinase [Deltaproteobacteria bacterium]|nr:serine/threonine protein kinase [Deltaproteobacteria bacterium]
MEAAQAVNPERFGRYILLDRIGEGGMAEVYRAIMPGAEGFKRTFVIKKILAKLNQSPEFVEMFVREARIIALLNHPNIVQVYDFGSVDGQYFLAMEYLRGHDVLAIIRRLRDMKRSFPVAIATFIAHEVAGCLAYAHALAGPDGRALNIVHRDVSPSNIMCLREGGVKLLDFGIASAVSDVSADRTDQSAFKGKLRYMAPERLRNEAFDSRSDLYSLGVVLWEMLTCRRLFRGANDAETLKNIFGMTVPAPSAQRPEVPPGLDAIVSSMLERDPDKRYMSGRQLADELEEVLRDMKHKSRHLPRLLVDLFGSSSHSSQVGMACLTPELLAEMGDEYSEVELADPAVEAFPAKARSAWRSWRAWGVVVGAAAALAILWAFYGLPSGRDQPAAASPPIPATPAVPEEAVPSPEAPAIPAPVAQPAGLRAAAEADTGRTTPAKAKRRRRALMRRARVDEGAIAGGRSIDPFAEAAHRGKR